MSVVLGLHDEQAHTRRASCTAGSVLELQCNQVPLGTAEWSRSLPAQSTEPAARLYNLRQWCYRSGRAMRLWIVRELRENGRMLRSDHLPPSTGSRMLDRAVLPKVQGRRSIV